MLDFSECRQYSCAQCSHRASYPFQLNHHVKMEHKNAYLTGMCDTVELEQYFCLYCSFKTFHKLDLYEHWTHRHVNFFEGHDNIACDFLHEKIVNYLCRYCQFNTKSSLFLAKYHESCIKTTLELESGLMTKRANGNRKQISRSRTNENSELLRRNTAATESSSKKRMRQTLKIRGEEYVNTVGKTIRAKKMFPNPCKQNCHNGCWTFPENERQKIFNYYWELSDSRKQKMFLNDCTEVSDIKRKRSNSKGVRKRTVTNKYFLINGSQKTPVCQQFLVKTLAIPHRILRTVLSKKGPQKGYEHNHEKHREKHVLCNRTSRGTSPSSAQYQLNAEFEELIKRPRTGEMVEPLQNQDKKDDCTCSDDFRTSNDPINGQNRDVPIQDPDQSSNVGEVVFDHAEMKQPTASKRTARVGEEEYVAAERKTARAKMLPNPCKQNCQNRCWRFPEQERQRNFNEYWELPDSEEQKKFLNDCVTVTDIKRKRSDKGVKKRTVTNKYFLTNGNRKILVCSQFLLKTLAIPQRLLRTVLANKQSQKNTGGLTYEENVF